MEHYLKWIPVVILALVFILLSIRKIGKVTFQIWQIMLGGAALALISGSISPVDALKAINPDVIFFLFGMFFVGEAMRRSGYLKHLAFVLFNRAKSVNMLILFLLGIMGLLSAILMNDTIAVIGTPLVLHFAREHKISPKLLLLTLCFSVTIGSVMSPIGNPQNLLIARERFDP